MLEQGLTGFMTVCVTRSCDVHVIRIFVYTYINEHFATQFLSPVIKKILNRFTSRYSSPPVT